MVAVVISQPMYLPWRGIFEQIKECDIFIHYDDADFSRGGFFNRVQIKGPEGKVWLTVPVKAKVGTSINKVGLDNNAKWQKKHLRTIEQFLAGQKYSKDAIDLAYKFLDRDYGSISDLNITAIEHISSYLGFAPKFIRSSAMQATGNSSERVLQLVKEVNGERYITGHGAANYLDHSIFEDSNIAVEYMDYNNKPYPQKYGEFDPYVTILDMIASIGQESGNYISPNTVSWQKFIEGKTNV